MRKLGFFATALTAGLLMTARTSVADVLFNSNGFEPPGYVSGFSLAGSPTTAVNNNDKFQTTAFGASSPTSFIQPYGTLTGNTQYLSLRATNSTAGSYSFSFPYTNIANPYTPAMGQGVAIQWTMLVASSTGSGTATGNPFFGVVAYGNNAANQRVEIGEAGVNATTGAIAGVSTINTTFPVSSGTYYFYQMLIDFTGKRYFVYAAPITASSYTLVGSAPFANTAVSFTDGDLAAFGITGTGYDGLAVMDSYIVQTAPVPEPAAIGLAALALPLLARKRKMSPAAV